MKLLLISAWVCASSALLSQTDSLERVLSKSQGQIRLSALEGLSRKLENTDMRRASSLALEALTLSRSVQNKLKEQQLLGWLGYLLRLQNKYDSSLLLYNQALGLAHDSNDNLGAAEYLNGMSQLARSHGNLSAAIHRALDALNQAEQADDLKQIGDALYNIGYVHQIQRSYDSAYLYFKKSLAVRRQSGDSISVANSYNGIGLVFMRKENYDEARQWYWRAASLVDDYTNPRLLSMVYNNLGITYENQGKFESGREYYYKSIDLKKKMGDKRGMASTYGNLGDNYNESERPDEAIKFATLSANLSRETSSLDYLITAHKILSFAYEKKGDFKNAYENYVLFHEYQDSLFNTNKAKEVNELITRYNVDKKERENEKLKASAAVSESILSRQKLIIIVSAVSLGLVLLGLNFLYKLYSQSKKLATELAVQKSEAEHANTQLTRAIQENTNITNFLVHDLKSPMNKIAGLTELIQKDGSLSYTQKAYASKVIEVVGQGRKLIDDLLAVNKPQSINTIAFNGKEFLEELVQEYILGAEQKTIKIKLSLPVQDLTIHTDQGLLGRALDNLLSNAIKFSPFGSEVKVRLEETKSRIFISIADHGPGFSEADKKSLYQKFKKLSARPTNGEPSSGLGLAIVKNIIDRLGGTISLISEPGTGAEFKISLPKVH